MKTSIDYLLNTASEFEIIEHLLACDADFVPPLSTRLEISSYAAKIASKATRFEAWAGDILVGLLAAYCNDQATRIAYITNVTVLREWTGKGIAAHLMDRCIEHAKASDMRLIRLEVSRDNVPAIRLYENSGFVAEKDNAPFVNMNLFLKSGKEHG